MVGVWTIRGGRCKVSFHFEIWGYVSIAYCTARDNLRQLDLKAIISTNRNSWFRPPPDEMGLIILVTNIKTWR